MFGEGDRRLGSGTTLSQRNDCHLYTIRRAKARLKAMVALGSKQKRSMQWGPELSKQHQRIFSENDKQSNAVIKTGLYGRGLCFLVIKATTCHAAGSLQFIVGKLTLELYSLFGVHSYYRWKSIYVILESKWSGGAECSKRPRNYTSVYQANTKQQWHGLYDIFSMMYHRTSEFF